MSSKGEQASTDIQIPCFGLEVKTNSYKITSIAFNFIKTTNNHFLCIRHFALIVLLNTQNNPRREILSLS